MDVNLPDHIQSYLGVKTKEDWNNHIKKYPGQHVLVLTVKYLRQCPMKELPLYLNHLNDYVRRVIQERLVG